MAFKGNDSNKEIVKEFKLYTGIQLMKPVAINPSLEELKQLGINFTKEPDYFMEPDENGNKRIVLTYYVKVDKINNLVPMKFYMTNAPDYSKRTDKYCFIDKFGKTGWDTKEGKCSEWAWINTDSVRIALKGEATLHDFFIKYLNTDGNDICRLDNPEKIFDGDYSELKEILKIEPENKFKGLLYVTHADNGKNYQNIYTGFFSRATSKSSEPWEKHINSQIASGYPIKGTYSYTFKEYEAVEPTIEVDNSNTSTSTPDLF